MTIAHLNIVVFAYKRPDHLEKCLQAIKRNSLSTDARLIVCIDGLKPGDSDDDQELQKKTIEVAGREKWCLENSILVNESNLGLVKQFFSKLDMLFTRYDHLVIVEDDIEVGYHFLDYMYKAFSLFGERQGISMIHGYTYFIKSFKKKNSCFFAIGSGNKAFGLTRTYWENVEKGAKFYVELKRNNLLKNELQEKKIDYYRMKIDDIESTYIKAWDVILAWNTLEKKLLCLSPDYTLAKDAGWDSRGASNTFGENIYDAKYFDPTYQITHFPAEVKADREKEKQVRFYFKYTLRLKFWRKRTRSVVRKFFKPIANNCF